MDAPYKECVLQVDVTEHSSLDRKKKKSKNLWCKGWVDWLGEWKSFKQMKGSKYPKIERLEDAFGDKNSKCS